MSTWWVGVKGSDLVVFEATEAEAKSEEFEETFGVAFGTYRSKEQADAGTKEHAAYMTAEAQKELENRQKPSESGENEVNLSNPAVIGTKTGRVVLEKPNIQDIPVQNDIEAVFNVFFLSLKELKVSIMRVLESSVALREILRESKDK